MGVRRCGWCNKILGVNDKIAEDVETTGICEICFVAEMKNIEKEEENEKEEDTHSTD